MRIGSGVDNIDVKVAEFVVYYYPDLTSSNFTDPQSQGSALILFSWIRIRQYEIEKIFIKRCFPFLNVRIFFLKYISMKEDNEDLYKFNLYYVLCWAAVLRIRDIIIF